MTRRSRRGGKSRGVSTNTAKRQVDYKHLKNTLIKQPSFSDDRLEAIHDTALRVIEELGIRVLNDAARDYFKSAGAEVDADSLMVKIDRKLVEQALGNRAERICPARCDTRVRCGSGW